MLSRTQGDLRFRRNDVFSTATASRGCMKVYPPGKKSRQKIAVGDSTGIVQAFSLGKHHDLQQSFIGIRQDQPISRIDLFTDQLFFACGARISAYSKKGKPFFGFESNLTEKTTSLKIWTPRIYAGGEFVLTLFQEVSELGFYMAPDRINDIAIFSGSTADLANGALNCVYLACQDRCMRTIKDVTQQAESACESPLTALTLAKQTNGVDLVYGTLAGTIGGFQVADSTAVTRKFSAIPQQRLGSVNAIACFDISKDGMADVLVGRDDGSVEVHTFGLNSDGSPSKAWEAQMGECVNSIDSGFITNTDREEVVIHTYSGKIVSFSYNEDDAKAQTIVSEALAGKQPDLPQEVQTAAGAEPSQAAILQLKVKEVEHEISGLRELIYQRKKCLGDMQGAAPNTYLKAITSEFHVRDKFILDASAALTLSVEVDTELDSVALQADVDVELIETPSNTVVSTNPPEHLSKTTKMLAVTRAAAERGMNRMELHFRPVEGQYGTLRAFIIPKAQPRTSQMRTYTIRSLSLHQRINEQEVDWASLPLSSLKISGNFTAKDAHSWVYLCLPEVPEMLQQEVGFLCFRNTFIGSVLGCKYGRGEAEFHSDNISTLAVLKECITKEATARKIQVRINSEARQESILRTLHLLHPLIDYQFTLVSKMKLIDSLKEIEGQEQDTKFLSDDYRDVLVHAKDIEREVTLQPKRMEYLRGLVIRLLVDRAMFRGEAAPHGKVHQLAQLLDQYNLDQVKNFFTVAS